jgi:hypothetical protein
MLEVQIRDYLQAVRRREAAVKRFAELTEFITDVTRRMADVQKNATPGRFSPKSSGVIPNPLALDGSRQTVIVEGYRWPTAEVIEKAKQELIAATGQVDKAWNSIPQDQRLGLSPPTGPVSSLV